MPKQLTPKIALDRAQWLCSQREKCVHEIKLKLTQWGIGAKDSQAILKSLVSDGFVNESRFALTFARDKARFNKWGPRKIEMALRAKRISKEDIEHALTVIQEFTSTENLTELLTKKAKTIKHKDKYDLKTKLIRFALGRGFEYENSLNIIEKIINA
jgi:regulatory protein